MDKVFWKVWAIISSIFLFLSVVLLVYINVVGSSFIDAEAECSANICFTIDEAISYDYDFTSGVCSCLDTDSVVIHQERLGD